MRDLPPRNPIPQSTQDRLQEETNRIIALNDEERKRVAILRYDSVRASATKSKEKNQNHWFLPVMDALEQSDTNCMYCSSNESAQVEHFRPKAVFPKQIFEYANYLWVCGHCNQHKSDDFPPDTQAGAQILNPFDDNVWEHLDLDTLGALIPKAIPNTLEVDPRGESTIRIIKLDRKKLQQKRMERFMEYKERAERDIKDYQEGRLTLEKLRENITKMRVTSLQTDVADYFLNGPGRAIEPFKTLLDLAESRDREEN